MALYSEASSEGNMSPSERESAYGGNNSSSYTPQSYNNAPSSSNYSNSSSNSYNAPSSSYHSTSYNNAPSSSDYSGPSSGYHSSSSNNASSSSSSSSGGLSSALSAGLNASAPKPTFGPPAPQSFAPARSQSDYGPPQQSSQSGVNPNFNTFRPNPPRGFMTPSQQSLDRTQVDNGSLLNKSLLGSLGLGPAITTANEMAKTSAGELGPSQQTPNNLAAIQQTMINRMGLMNGDGAYGGTPFGVLKGYDANGYATNRLKGVIGPQGDAQYQAASFGSPQLTKASTALNKQLSGNGPALPAAVQNATNYYASGTKPPIWASASDTQFGPHKFSNPDPARDQTTVALNTLRPMQGFDPLGPQSSSPQASSPRMTVAQVPPVPKASPASPYSFGSPQPPGSPLSSQYAQGSPQVSPGYKDPAGKGYDSGYRSPPSMPDPRVAQYAQGSPQPPSMPDPRVAQYAQGSPQPKGISGSPAYSFGSPQPPGQLASPAQAYSFGSPQPPSMPDPRTAQYAKGSPQPPSMPDPRVAAYSKGYQSPPSMPDPRTAQYAQYRSPPGNLKGDAPPAADTPVAANTAPPINYPKIFPGINKFLNDTTAKLVAINKNNTSASGLIATLDSLGVGSDLGKGTGVSGGVGGAQALLTQVAQAPTQAAALNILDTDPSLVILKKSDPEAYNLALTKIFQSLGSVNLFKTLGTGAPTTGSGGSPTSFV